MTTELGVIQFVWKHGGSKVEVVGSFSGGNPVPLKPSVSFPGQFYVDYTCPQGQIEYRCVYCSIHR